MIRLKVLRRLSRALLRSLENEAEVEGSVTSWESLGSEAEFEDDVEFLAETRHGGNNRETADPPISEEKTRETRLFIGDIGGKQPGQPRTYRRLRLRTGTFLSFNFRSVLI